MTPDPLIPDYVPEDVQRAHLQLARRQVRRTRSAATGPVLTDDDAPRPATPQPTSPGLNAVAGNRAPEAGDGAGREAIATPDAAHEETESKTPAVDRHAFAALLVGMVGSVLLTGVWTWLALTAEPLWWWYTGLGLALAGALAAAAVVLDRRFRRWTAETAPC